MTKINFNLSENEKQILDTMWMEKRALTRSEIINFTKNKTWKETSIHILLNQLLDKHAIKVDKIVKTGKSFGRTYKPTLTRDEYELMQLETFFKETNPSNPTLINFFSSLIKSKKIDKSFLDDLELLIQSTK